MSKLARCSLFLLALALLPLTPATDITESAATAAVTQLDRPPRGAPPGALAAVPRADVRHAQLTLEWVLTNEGADPIRDVELYVPIPGDRDNQRDSGLVFSEPYERVEDRYDQPVARFQFREVAAGEVVTVSWTAGVEIEARDYRVDPARVGRLDEIPADIRHIYTQDEALYRLNSPLIQRVAKEAAGGATNAYWMARNIHDFVADRLAYDLDGKWGDAAAVYRQKTGSCSEYTFLFIALARANGLPARYVGGTVLPREEPYVDTVFHRWAEVYLPHYGWVPVDVTHDDRKSGLSHEYFAAVTSERFVTTISGGDSDYLAWLYHSSFRYRYSGQKPEIRVERSFRWAPVAQRTTPPRPPAGPVMLEKAPGNKISPPPHLPSSRHAPAPPSLPGFPQTAGTPPPSL